MIRSMTAFARQQIQAEFGSLVCEIRSVNHRYIDLSLRLPEPLREIEMDLRDTLNQQLSRGKIECSFRYQASGIANTNFTLDETAFRNVLRKAREINAELINPADISALELMQWPGVLQPAASDDSALQQAAMQLLTQTLTKLLDMRATEGEKLSAFIQQRLQAMQAELTKIDQRLPELKQQQRQRLQTGIAELQGSVNQERLEQEVLLLVQKADVAEELHRLRAHMQEVKKTITSGGVVGRRLDFISQELNREANTLAAKSVNSDITQSAVELKVAIEQIREQVQNIE